MSIQFKSLLAAAAVTLAGVAVAQGTPPNPAAADPAVGAGQQSTQGTSMGVTGTPAGDGTATMGASGTTSGTTTSSGSTMTPSTSGTTTGSGTMSSGTTAGSSTTTDMSGSTASNTTRPMRADRN